MHARVRTIAVAAALTAGLTLGTFAQTPATRTLELSFPEPGLVTLVASNVTVREILADWTKQTGAVFTNADRLAGGPVTVQYDRLPEEAVVRSLLRSAAGLMIVPRDPGPVALSRVASVYIVPTSRGTTTGTAYAPSMPAPVAADLVTPGSPDLEIPPALPGPENPPAQTPPATVGRPNTPGVIVPIVPVIGTGSGRGGAGGGSRGTPPPPPTGTGSGS